MKTKFSLAQAEGVAHLITLRLLPLTTRIIVAGSIRRRKPKVGDIEIVYIPKTFTTEGTPGILFNDGIKQHHNEVDDALQTLLDANVIQYRTNVRGSIIWGEKNKLARHVSSGIPIDFFSTTEAAWWNYLVCRTGGAENNKAIAMAANRRGWTWNPYGEGFTELNTGDYQYQGRKSARMESEEAVYEFVGMPFLKPERRR